MTFRRANLTLIAIMVVIAVTISGVTLAALYQTAFEQTRQNLISTARSQAYLMEAVARFDQKYSSDFPEGSKAATLSQIDNAFKSEGNIGETDEFLLGHRVGDKIVFLSIASNEGAVVPAAVPFAGSFDLPMRRALNGEEGVMEGLDYDGVPVLAAYQYVDILDFGIVFKIDIAEIRAPFLKTGGVLVLFSVFLIAGGSALFFRISNPMIRRIRESEHRYRHMVENTRVIAWELDLKNFRFTYVSPHAEELLGYKIEEWKAENFWPDHIHPDDREGAVTLCAGATKAGKDHDFEYRMLKSDGTYIWMRDIVTVNMAADGSPVSLSGFLVNIDDEKRNKEELISSEARYERAVAGTHDGIWDWNVNTGDVSFSSRWAEILDYEVSDLEPIAETFTNLVHPDDKKLVSTRTQAHFDHDKPYDIEFRMRNKNGQYIWVQSKGSAVRDQDGKPIFMAGAITDITNRKLNQVKLLKSEQNLAITLNSIGDAVITTDADGCVTRMNAVAVALTGWSFQAAHGLPLKTIFPIIDVTTREPIQNPVEKVLASGDTVYLSNHTTLIAKDGSEYQISDSAAPIRGDDDKILGMVLVFNDVTEAYHLREKAKAIQDQLQSLFDDMQTMVAITAPDGTIEFINKLPLRMSGQKQEDVIGKKMWDCSWCNYDPDVQKMVQDDCIRAQAGEIVHRDLQMATTEGLSWASYIIHPVNNEDGQVIQLLHEGRDISYRKKMEDGLITAKEEAEHANIAKSEFLASMSHELRTPLNAIMGFGQMLQYNPKEGLSKKQNEYVDNILTGGNHLLNLINEILDLSQIEAEQAAIFLEEVDAGDIIKNSISQIFPLAETKGIKFINQVEMGIDDLLRTDQKRFKQIMINLLSNAVKYNVDGGTITVDCQKTQAGFLHISVKDTGIGIVEQDHANIFKIFQRLGSSSEIAREGTGIGLSICKLLTEQMGGRIDFESALGEGSTFWVELPLASNKNILIWSDNLRVGVDAIDKDHQVIIALNNKISSEFCEEAELNDIILEIVEYTRYHFSREEVIMEICGYPDLKEHRGRHQKLITKVNNLADDWRKDNDPEIRQQLCHFLRDWWIGHIMKVDTEIVQYTKGKKQEIRQALKNIK